jgi:hypothetical protein
VTQRDHDCGDDGQYHKRGAHDYHHRPAIPGLGDRSALDRSRVAIERRLQSDRRRWCVIA